jgi:hypothetical protein
MPKSKHRKDHKKKVAARNKRIADNKKTVEKAQREFIMNLIKREQENGAFDNTPSISIDGPSVDSTVEGPSI